MAWPLPDRTKVLENDRVRLVPLDVAAHGSSLYQAASFETNGEDIFLYHLGSGPFTNETQFLAHLETQAARPAELTYTVFSKRREQIVGAATLMNVRSDHGSVEVGSIWYTKKAQRTEVNTNTMYLLFSSIFEDLKYRRLEWKCNNENEASKRAALRLGFQYEGLFRQHFWDKGKNRDTAWFSIVDGEWAGVRARFQSLLLRP